MGFGRIRTVVQQRIDEEYIVLKGLISESNVFFKTYILKLSELEVTKIASIDEDDLEIKLSIQQSITSQYDGVIEHYESISTASRRVYLIAIFSYCEGCLNYIIRTNRIRCPKNPNIYKLLKAIEGEKGRIPSEAKVYEELITSELRILRNLCTHPKEGTKNKALDIIQRRQGLEICNDQLVILENGVLMYYLNVVKALLQILDKHCSR